MEASNISRRPGLKIESPSAPPLRKEARDNFVNPARALAEGIGDFASFTTRAVGAMPGTFRYSAEVLRQAGLIITGSALVIWLMMFITGTMCATEANYTLRSYGATVYSGVFTQYCGWREMSGYMFAYIVSAKVACGFVAEIGSMRINEEIDALESLGISSMRYVVATRLLGCALAFPFIVFVGLVLQTIATYLVIVVQIGEVSRGGYEFVYFAFGSPLDLFFALCKCMVQAGLCVVVGCYFGYRASGGPVGVGTATARSMIVNMMLIHIVSSLLTMMFWGLNPNQPIGG
jgi:phospholipid/cholesterol/gamma-HCH transport system permease protein